MESYGISPLTQKIADKGEVGIKQVYIEPVSQGMAQPSVGITQEVRKDVFVKPLDTTSPAAKAQVQDMRKLSTIRNIAGEKYLGQWPDNYRVVYMYIFDRPSATVPEIATALNMNENEVDAITDWLDSAKIIKKEALESEYVPEYEVSVPETKKTTETKSKSSRKKFGASAIEKVSVI